MSEWLIRAEVSEQYRIPIGTLENWASRGEGPRFAKVGRRTLYRRADCERFMDEHMVEPTRAAGGFGQ